MKGAALLTVLIGLGSMGAAISLLYGATGAQQSERPLVGDCAMVAAADPALQRAVGCPVRTASRAIKP